MSNDRFQAQNQPDLIHPDLWQGPPSSLVERLWNVPQDHPTDQEHIDSLLRILLSHDTVRILLKGGELTRLVPTQDNQPPGNHPVAWPFTQTVYAEFPGPLPYLSEEAPALMFGMILIRSDSDDSEMTSVLPTMDDDDNLLIRCAKINLKAWTAIPFGSARNAPNPASPNIMLHLIALLAQGAPRLQALPLSLIETQRLRQSGAPNPWLTIPNDS